MKDRKVSILIVTIIVIMAILALQLMQLQIFEHASQESVARGNALQQDVLIPPRGAIFDRHGTLIVGNASAFDIALTPRHFMNPRDRVDERIALLASHLDLQDSVVVTKLDEARRWSSYRPKKSFSGVEFENFSRIQEDNFRLPGVVEEVSQARNYPSPARATHALGYINEVSRADLESQPDPIPWDGTLEEKAHETCLLSGPVTSTDPSTVPPEYQRGDLIGRSGVERTFENCLRGIPGSALRVVNVHGLEVTSYLDGQGDIAPIAGYDIHLAMDIGVQALAESLFVNKRGAAVAIDVKTGGIIALHSAPDFDPALFTGGIDYQDWLMLNEDPQKPLYNRATMNQMPPGSTWKPFMTLMALNTGLIRAEGENSTISCGGIHPMGAGHNIFKCLGRHGPQNPVQAITNSCNTFFFELARRFATGYIPAPDSLHPRIPAPVTVDTFQEYANAFGFGVRVPTDIREQTPGLIPDLAYFDRMYGVNTFPRQFWGPSTVMSMGIGQGNMGVTPLQLALYTAAVANGGWMHEPRLVSHAVHEELGDTISFFPQPTQITFDDKPIPEMYYEMVRTGMRFVMEQTTGRLAQIPDIPSGGKTGTAQAPGDMVDHSVFIMFAPFDDPQIAVAVQCENTGGGSGCAAPIASLMAERFLKGELPDTYGMRFRMNRALNVSSQLLPEMEEALQDSTAIDSTAIANNTVAN